MKSRKPTRGGARPGAGRPATTERTARAITLRLSAAEDRALTAAAGSRTAVGSYLREAGLALAKFATTLRPGESRSAYVAAAIEREAAARRDEPTERPRARKE